MLKHRVTDCRIPRIVTLLPMLLMFGQLQAQQHTPTERQSSRRDALQVEPLQVKSLVGQLDLNNNGTIDRDELGEQAGPLFDILAHEVGTSPAEPIPVDLLEKILGARPNSQRQPYDPNAWYNRLDPLTRGYYLRRLTALAEAEARQKDASVPNPRRRRIRNKQEPAVPAFGDPEVGGFGLEPPNQLTPTPNDLERAESVLARYDRNQDGVISREESRRTRWFGGDPFVDDLNGDEQLDLQELGLRYARRRVAEETRKAERRGESSRGNNQRGGSDSSTDARERSGQEREQSDTGSGSRERWERESRWSRNPSRSNGYRGGYSRSRSSLSRRTQELTGSILFRHDLNRNGILERSEWPKVGRRISRADADRNSEVDRDELLEWLSQQVQASSENVSDSLPGWFYELDSNQDGQVSMAEFATDWDSEKAYRFLGYDANGDGFISGPESLLANRTVGQVYGKEEARVLMPRRTLTSRITIAEDYAIEDLDVQLSITHTNAEQIDAFLIGPEGQMIELFTGVGDSDDHFDGTILDDEADQRIVSGDPPFRGRFQPESRTKRKPSLQSFYGRSVRGAWQLQLRTSRADRPGMLHKWALIVKRRAGQLPTDRQSLGESRSVGQQRSFGENNLAQDDELNEPLRLLTGSTQESTNSPSPGGRRVGMPPTGRLP